MNIVIADDDRTTCDFIKVMLEEDSRNQATTVGDGIALEILLTAHPEEYDLAIVDINLPSRNGVEVVSNLRARGISIPIIFISGDMKSYADFGKDMFIEKPFDMKELKTALNKMRETIQGLCEEPQESEPQKTTPQDRG